MSRYDTPMAAVVLAALLLVTLLGVRLVAADGPDGVVVAGDAFVGADRPADLQDLATNSTGYDGQFVYRLALDPFTRDKTAYGITLDNPPYRQQRLGLPFVARAVHRATKLPLSTTLLIVNALALLAAAWAAAALAQRLHRHALWGVLVALSPGLVVAVCRDLTEPLATALLLLGLVAWTDRRWRLATLAFTGAVLTRETTLAVLFGLGLYEVYATVRGPDRRAIFSRAVGLLMPVVAAVRWQGHLKEVWGRLPVRANDGNVGIPVAHTVRTLLAGGGQWSDWHTKDALLAHLWVAERLVLVAILAATAYAVWRGTTSPALKAAWVTSALLALSAAWTRDVAFLRAANEALVIGLFVLLGSRTATARRALAATAGLSAVAALLYGALL